MPTLDIKSLNQSEPLTLYSKLDMNVKMGESFATSKLSTDNGTYYLLGGLEVNNLNTSSLSEETMGQLINALESDKIGYAVFPGDQRKGQLPLVLDSKARAYIETALPELVTNKYVNWYIYKLPSNIDPDDNEQASSQVVLKDSDSEDKLVVSFNDIHPYLASHGFVEDNGEDDLTIDDMKFEEKKEVNLEDEVPVDYRNDMILDTDNAGNHDYKNEDNESDDTLQNEVDTDQNSDEDADFDEIFGGPDIDENDNENNEKSSDEDEGLEPEETEETETNQNEDVNPENYPEAIESEDETSTNELDNDPLGLNEELEDEDFEETNVPIDINGDELVDEKGKAYEEIPESLQRILDSIKLPRIKHKPKTGQYDEVVETINAKADEYNDAILHDENEIKNKMIQLYQAKMAQSYNEIKQNIDVHNGDEFIKDGYSKMRDRQSEVDDKYETELLNEKNRLQNEFETVKYKEYEEAVLKTLFQKFTDEYYYDYVQRPLDEFEESINDKAYNEKARIENEWDDWLETVEKAAYTNDQKRAVISISKQVEDYINKYRPTIDTYRKDLSESYNQGIIQEIQRISIEKSTEALQKEMAKKYTDENLKEKEDELKKAKESSSTSQEEIENLQKELNEIKSELQLKNDELLNERRQKEMMREDFVSRERDKQAYYNNMVNNQFTVPPNSNVVATPMMTDQSNVVTPTEQANTNVLSEKDQQIKELQDTIQKQNDDAKNAKKENSKKSKWAFVLGIPAGVIALSILGSTIVMDYASDDDKSQNEPKTEQQVQSTQSDNTKQQKDDSASKLPVDNYKKGDVIKGVESPDGKKEDLVVDDLMKDEDSLLVHKKSDSDKALDYSKDKEDYEFYRVPVQGFK